MNLSVTEGILNTWVFYIISHDWETQKGYQQHL